MKKILISTALSLITVFAFAQAIGSAPSVSNVTISQNGGTITVGYDLTYAYSSVNSNVTLVLSGDGGTTFKIYPHPNYLSGDVGANITPGNSKSIVWNAGTQYLAESKSLNVVGQNWQAKVIARRSDEFVVVDGDQFNGSVTIDRFYIGRHEVTQEEYAAVMESNPSQIQGGGILNLPVEFVNWFEAVVYCNFRSMQEHLTPCYTFNDGTDYGTNPDDWQPDNWYTYNEKHIHFICDWDATGYRLPTEAEWHHAANEADYVSDSAFPYGSPYQYAGSNTIGNVAWYSVNSSSTTHTVGNQTPNALNIYDMSGNVFELVWDIYGSTFPSGGNNPKGATSGDNRVGRGGGWLNTADNCTVDYRALTGATSQAIHVGFRIAKK